MESILKSHPVLVLKKEISKTNIKGYSKMKKAEVVKLMLKHQDRFKHIKMKEAKKKEVKKEVTLLTKRKGKKKPVKITELTPKIKKKKMSDIKKEVVKIIGAENIDFYAVLQAKSEFLGEISKYSVVNLFFRKKNGIYELTLNRSVSNEKIEKLRKFLEDGVVDAGNLKVKIETMKDRDKANSSYKNFLDKKEANKFKKDLLKKK